LLFLFFFFFFLNILNTLLIDVMLLFAVLIHNYNLRT